MSTIDGPRVRRAPYTSSRSGSSRSRVQEIASDISLSDFNISSIQHREKIEVELSDTEIHLRRSFALVAELRRAAGL